MKKQKSNGLTIPVIVGGSHPLPQYATPQSAGLDLTANLPSGSIELQPLGRAIIPTGLKIALPENMEAQIRPRSGLAIKKGLTVLNSPGTIDADYRGEIGVILINLSSEVQRIEDGERIAQMIFANVARFDGWEVTEKLPETMRGSGGFGSTGTK